MSSKLCPTTPRATLTKQGFTLIELLVVIAIIGILASILFPVFARARENARRSSCQSNLKQLGLGMTMYAQDFDETYPTGFAYGATGTFPPFTGGSSKAQAWDVQIRPYVGQNISYGKKAALFQCPSDSLERSAGTGDARRTYVMAGAGTIGGYTSTENCVSGGFVGKIESGFAGPVTSDNSTGTDGFCYSRGRKLSELPAPSETLQLIEAPSKGNITTWANSSIIMRPVNLTWQTRVNCETTVTYASGCGQDANLDPTHLEGWNYLFADGHVKWLRPEATKGTGTIYTPKGYWTIAAGD